MGVRKRGPGGGVLINLIPYSSGHKTAPPAELKAGGPFEVVDAAEREGLEGLLNKYGVTEIYHLASLLSATSEHNPDLAWHINVDSLKVIFPTLFLFSFLWYSVENT